MQRETAEPVVAESQRKQRILATVGIVQRETAEPVVAESQRKQHIITTIIASGTEFAIGSARVPYPHVPTATGVKRERGNDV